LAASDIDVDSKRIQCKETHGFITTDDHMRLQLNSLPGAMKKVGAISEWDTWIWQDGEWDLGKGSFRGFPAITVIPSKQRWYRSSINQRMSFLGNKD
jgi:hypothetical protein